MSSTPTSTWTTAQSKISVLVNGVYIPFESVPDSLQRFVRPAVFSTDDDLWELQHFGSATMVRYYGRNLAITTAHQTGDGLDAPKLEKFVIVVDDGTHKLSVPPTSAHKVWANRGEGKLAEDIIIYEYRDRVPVKSAQHLNLNSVFWSDSAELTVDYSFLIGFPSESIKIELDSNDETSISEYTLRWIRQDLESTERQVLEPDNRDFFAKHSQSTRRSVEPDGLSGCPVYSIVHNRAKDRYLRFDGIVTHARQNRFAVYPSSLIRQLLDSMNDEAD